MSPESSDPVRVIYLTDLTIKIEPDEWRVMAQDRFEKPGTLIRLEVLENNADHSVIVHGLYRHHPEGNNRDDEDWTEGELLEPDSDIAHAIVRVSERLTWHVDVRLDPTVQPHYKAIRSVAQSCIRALPPVDVHQLRSRRKAEELRDLRATLAHNAQTLEVLWNLVRLAMHKGLGGEQEARAALDLLAAAGYSLPEAADGGASPPGTRGWGG